MLFAAVCLLLLPVAALSSVLRMSLVVFRHGDRTPAYTFPLDENVWPEGKGRLTARGREQCQRLGSFLRERYNATLSPWFSLSETVMRSSDSNRTMASAEAVLSALYPPVDGVVQTVSITAKPNDPVVKMDLPCPAYDVLWQATLLSAECQAVYADNKSLLDSILSSAGYGEEYATSSRVWDVIWDIYDPIRIARFYNRTVPVWANSTVLSLLSRLEDVGFVWLFSGADKSRLRGGFLLEDLLAKMASNASQRLFLYSGHDYTVASLLASLQVFDGRQPEYVSAVVLELTESGMVSVLYKAGDGEELRPLSVPGCGTSCPLRTLQRVTEAFRPRLSFEEECQLQTSSAARVSVVLCWMCVLWIQL